MHNTTSQKASNIGFGLLLSAAALTLAGCSTPYTGFGQSVRNMVAQQTLDPLASSKDPEKSIRPMDGAQAARVLEVHRENIAKPEDTSNDIIVNIGQ